MKVQLNEDGYLHIISESTLEAYALKCWADNNDLRHIDITLQTGQGQIKPEPAVEELPVVVHPNFKLKDLHPNLKLKDLTQSNKPATINIDWDHTPEVWKEIEGSDGGYEISNKGQIKSHLKGRDKILIQSVDNDGYKYLRLQLGDHRPTLFVHRLVAQHFLDNPFNQPMVSHKNGDNQDNRAENLEWVCTPGLTADLEAPRIGKPVVKCTLDGEPLEIYDSLAQAAKLNGMNSSASISSACRGLIKKSGGYKWKYLNKQVK